MAGSLRSYELKVVSPEDYVLLKVLATRDRDMEDAASVMEALRGRLDEDLMRREAAALAAEIGDHDVAGRFAALMQPRP